ncbi:MAG: hypothetical protein IJR33_10745, partial [Clostridia bacterium]|nr:hypothetical protein [Clostridia bacterium]
MKIRKFISGLLSLSMAISIINIGITASADVEDTAATELLSNGGFESDIGGIKGDWKFGANATGNWETTYGYDNSVDTSDTHSGEKSIQLWSSSTMAIGQRITTLEPAAYYEFEAYIKGNSEGTIQLMFGNGDKTYPFGTSSSGGLLSAVDKNATTDWELVTTDFKTSSSLPSSGYVVGVQNPKDSGVALHIDDVSLKKKLVRIDYENRKLTGFVSDEAYTVTGNEITTGNKAAGSTELDIDDTWFSKQLTITYGTVNQYLTLPSDTNAPTESDFTVTQPEAADGTGTVAGITSAMEYKIGNGEWTDGTGADVSDIPDKSNVQVRIKATENTFASKSYTIKISSDGSEPDTQPVGKTEFTGGILENGDTVVFDFGSAASDGTIQVDAEKDYFGAADTDSKLTYGFLGLGEDGYSKTTYRDDAFDMVKDQRIWLLNGGNDAAAGVAGDNVYAKQDIRSENYGEKEYAAADSVVPIRFAVKADRHSYYKVKATVGCGDTTQGTTVSVFSERRHPAVTDLSIAAGETKTVEFTANVMDVYFKNDGKTYADDMLTFTIIGKNAGLASLEITRIDPEDAPAAIWVCSDSTGCDQYSYLPFYPLQNYAGVGQYLSKYLTNMTVSNQGEGGLASGDNAHFNSAVSQWKSGDYLYVEYGHNENSTSEYKTNLEKYYTAAHGASVKLIVVAPIDRANSFNSTTGTWTSTLSGYKDAAKKFVEAKIEAGATDIAFVDLNTPWVNFMSTETQRIANVRLTQGTDTNLTYSQNAIHYYYTYNKLGAADKTHINDYGADNASYLFFEALKSVVTDGASAAENSAAKIQSDVLKPIYDDLKEGVTASKVSDDVIKDGYAPNSHYPAKFTARIEYPYSASIEEITQNENGTLKSAKVRILQDLLAYAAVYVTAYDENNNVLGTFHSTVQGENTGHIDNTSDGAGVVKELLFDSDIVPHHFDATVYYCDKENVRLTEADLRAAVSPKYESRKITEVLLSDDFSSYESEASVIGSNDWSSRGNSISATKQTDTDGSSYLSFKGNANSQYLFRSLGKTINSGKLEISFKARYASGSAGVRFSEKVASNNWGSWRPAGGGNLTYSGTSAKNGSVDIGEVNTDEWIDYRVFVDLNNSSSEVYCGAYGTTEAPITFNEGENITQLLINSA